MRASLRFSGFVLASLLACRLIGCGQPVAPESAPERSLPRPWAEAALIRLDTDEAACRLRARALLDQPSGETPEYDRLRAEVLGRARGEPMVFVREPVMTAFEALPDKARAVRMSFDKGRPGVRVLLAAKALQRYPAALRALLLREGYAYAPDPHDALALVRDVRLTDLFDEPEIWLQRATHVERLERSGAGRSVMYRYAEGPSAGREAQMVFGDRIAVRREGLDRPLHRDVRALALDLAFDRMRIVHRTDDAMIADMRFGERTIRGVLVSEGAAIHLQCVVGGADERRYVEAWKTAHASRQRAIRAMQATVDLQVQDAFRFDRPRDEQGPDKDGFLRPLWLDAYRRGQPTFGYDGVSYAVFDRRGRAWPPEVCVDFVLDTYERTAGTWFSSPPDPPGRVVGRLDFDIHGIKNRRGVLSFGEFAADHPELFEFRRFQGAERIPFALRTAFFQFLVDHADDFAPGDVVAIQGLKRDGRIHQHAILVEAVDPLTGFPYGLADQMKVPRRRTWEGIMAEAPKRSLLYRARPRAPIFDAMDPGPVQ